MTDAATAGDIDRITPTRRPETAPAGYQTWSTLLFVHWKVPSELLRPLLPDSLTVDTFDGDAWIGMVPFHMSGVRPTRWLPAIPGTSSFHETNLRTYVHYQGRDPGVWFFSLEAANRLAVLVARHGWHLSYYYARMQIEHAGSSIRYHSLRTDGNSKLAAEVRVQADVSTDEPHHAVPGTLEHFLAERYLLYSVNRRGELYRGRVYHTPYPLQSARLTECHQTLTDAAGIGAFGQPDHVLFSPGVTVDIHALKRHR